MTSYQVIGIIVLAIPFVVISLQVYAELGVKEALKFIIFMFLIFIGLATTSLFFLTNK